ncbi:MAG TPA: GntR family transcriptional regulator [Caldilineaceae bacterium]|nr:GntR family transcriptional regulator [Caldilineaceae bacterium]
MEPLPALQAERLTDTVYTLLREQILSGRFAPGERLHVDALAQQLHISQTPIKGALALLVADGLVEVQPRRGTFITQVSPRQLGELLAIRRALELLATETLLDHITAADIARLRSLVEDIARAETVDAHYRGNFEFHTRLVALSGNRKLTELYSQLNGHIHMALIHSSTQRWRARAAAEAQEHHAILDALTNRDLAALRAAITAHLSRASTSLLDDLTAHRPAAQPNHSTS